MKRVFLPCFGINKRTIHMVLAACPPIKMVGVERKNIGKKDGPQRAPLMLVAGHNPML
jgi:hypothetical protein